MKSIERLFNLDLTVTRRTRTEDGQGGWTESWVTGVTIRGRVCPASSSERKAYAQKAGAQYPTEITHTLYCLANVDIQRGDRLTCPNSPDLEVLAVREPSWTGYHWEVDLSEIQTGA